jgi:ubiquinone/menaquinone biosynthesis C-methylase UbiE
MRVIDAMKRDWDERARKNAFHYIASWRTDWDARAFFESGEEDYRRLVKPILTEMNFEPRGKCMVEIGCGAGRMTRVFAREFAHVDAIDISDEMQRRAKEYLQDFPNIRWILADGATLSGVTAESADFVFSYLVIQHLPSHAIANTLLREILRALKPGGVFLLQFNGARRPTMNWKGRTAWGMVNALWSAGLQRAARMAASALALDPEMVGKSWHGIAIESADIRRILESAGAKSLRLTGEATPMAWCSGVCGVRVDS